MGKIAKDDERELYLGATITNKKILLDVTLPLVKVSTQATKQISL
jgi:hypothetical protein